MRAIAPLVVQILDILHRPRLALAQLALWAVFAAGFTWELIEHLGYRDWMHSYWSSEAALICLFFGSGVLLCRTWPDDAEHAFGSARRSGAIDFLVMILVLACMPFVLPDPHPTGRNLGEPLRRAWELALWGLGAARPEALDPITEPEMLRNVGHLPREVTVAMGTTLIAALVVIAFSLLALLSRLIRAQRRRIAFLLLAPPIASVACAVEVLDPLDERIWTSDPALMRSYGPTLLVAIVLAGASVSACGLAWRRHRRAARDSRAPSPRGASPPAAARPRSAS